MNTNLNPKIKDFLASRGYDSPAKLDKLLNPSLEHLHDPFLLEGMDKAVERIKRAQALGEKIVIYGDYDCDGISACVILYKYFKSIGVDVKVYIPNRFDDGYGLSFDMISEIKRDANPDLIITVDLGVTAVKEVEEVKRLNMDIIITDHHEKGEKLPNAIVIDPKIEGQKYPFNGLCGAGVALKLVEALAGREEVKKYLDIAAIATIGDIVPLVDENRAIAKLGLEKIGRKECLKSYQYMLHMLSLENLSGQDVAFKIVPRINASGRMSQGKKVFDFLIEEDTTGLSEKYSDIIKDNDARLESISGGVKALEEGMKRIDLSKENIILLKGDFHQGVLGILASRICHDYSRPAIIFTKTEEGTLKGSGRSIEGIDLHALLSKLQSHLIRFGGHKMAVGVEIEEKNFESFKRALCELLSKAVSIKNFALREEFDIQICEDDIDKNFISCLELLEPFGCDFEKPVMMLKAGMLSASQMKDNAYKHYKINTKNKKSIVCFNGSKHIETLKNNSEKDLIVELENNYFKGKVYPQAILKDVYLKQIKLKSSPEKERVISLSHKFFSFKERDAKIRLFELCDLEKLLKEKEGNGFGTIVVCDSQKVADKLRDIWPINNYAMSHIPLSSAQNTVLVSQSVFLPEDFRGYKNIIFTRSVFAHEKDVFAKDYNVYLLRQRQSAEFALDSSRSTNVLIYNAIRKNARNVKANSLFEWLEKLKAIEGAFSIEQLAYSLLSFADLGFLQIKFGSDFSISLNENPVKRELTSSQFMKRVGGR